MDSKTYKDLKEKILNFRVEELQMLLLSAKKNRTGKKTELQQRALELLRQRPINPAIQRKIEELHCKRFTATSYGGLPDSDNSRDSTDVAHHSSHSSHSSGMITRSAASQQHHSQGSQHQHQGPNSSPLSLTLTRDGNYYRSMPTALIQNATQPTNDYVKPVEIFQQPSQTNIPQFPVYPDVRFKHLPFYDVEAELLKPSSLLPTAALRFQEQNFSFHLSPSQADLIASNRSYSNGKFEFLYQVQLRFCLLETSCDQEDNFPPGVIVKVNGKIAQLPNPLPTNKPGVEPKRPSRPVNITQYCRLSPVAANQISVSWNTSDFARAFTVGVFLVKQLNSAILLDRIKKKGIRNPDFTRAIVKEKLAPNPDSEIVTACLRGSLLCPLGKMRMTIPCRATTCEHVQCFDVQMFLQMNEKKPTWVCPVCDKPALYKDLMIDGLFTEIVTDAAPESIEVQFHEDGSWTPVLPKKEEEKEKASSRKRQASPEPEQDSKKKKQIEVITLDSSSDESDSDTDVDEGRDGPSLAANQSNRSTPVVLSGSSSASGTPTHPASAASPGSDSSIPTNMAMGTDNSSSASSFVQALMSARRSPSAMQSFGRAASNYPMPSSSNASRTSAHPHSQSSSASQGGYSSMASHHLNPSPFFSVFPAASNDFLNSINPLGNEMFAGILDQLENYRNMHRNNSTRSRPDNSREHPDIISIDDD